MPVAAAADDILRCFWKCFSTYLRAVLLRPQLHYSHLEGLLNHSFLGSTWRGGSGVRRSLRICISNKVPGAAIADAAGPETTLPEPLGFLAAT